MPSTMVLNMADPGVKKIVDGWADNTEYEATVKIRTGAGPQRNVAEVIEFIPEDAEESPETETEEEPMSMKGKTPMKGKMGIKVKYF